MFRFAIIITALSLFWGCVETKPVNRYERIAKAYCECTFEIAQINREMEELSNDSTKRAEMLAHFQKLEQAYTKARECSATVISQFGKLKREEFPKIEQHLSTLCPDLVNQQDLLQELLGE